LFILLPGKRIGIWINSCCKDKAKTTSRGQKNTTKGLMGEKSGDFSTLFSLLWLKSSDISFYHLEIIATFAIGLNLF